MITFAVPWALAGLAAVAVPLLLHLVARREPPVVTFPAVRYLEDTARRHQRRFQLQHWLLLLVRMALIAALVLAAAGPSRPGAGPAGHAPAALVLIVDNSLSSAAIQEGRPVLAPLLSAARRILDRAGSGDRLWLVTADGQPRSGDAAALGAVLADLAPTPLRLDLGAVLTLAQNLLAAASLPGEIVLLTDLQASALGPAPGRHLLVGAPGDTPPANLGIAALETGPQPWSGAGRVTVTVAGDTGTVVPAAVTINGRPVRQLLLAGGGTGTALVPAPGPGWHVISVALDPDELLLDDRAQAAVRVAPPARVDWPADGSYLAAAAAVLHENGRILRGSEVRLDGIGPRTSIVFPPADPAELGALNRALVARGTGWQFGELIGAPARTDSSAMLDPQELRRRHRLRASAAAEGVMVTAAGEPWLVRDGDLVLVASRLEPEWTPLPVSAAFMPFMDLLLNRIARGEVARLAVAPGGAVSLPDRVTAVADAGGERRVEGGARWTPVERGLVWLLAGRDTIGVVEVNPDRRETDLRRAGAAQVAALWPGARLATPDEAASLAFTLTARADLRAPLLWLALVLALAELALAGLGRRRG